MEGGREGYREKEGRKEHCLKQSEHAPVSHSARPADACQVSELSPFTRWCLKIT